MVHVPVSISHLKLLVLLTFPSQLAAVVSSCCHAVALHSGHGNFVIF